MIISRFSKVRYWKHEIKSKAKYHITVGHLTVLGRLFLFRGDEQAPDPAKKYPFIEEVPESEKEIPSDVYGILLLDKPCFLREQSFFIGSRLDLSVDSKECRMAFCGTALQLRNHDPQQVYEEFTLTKNKRKEGEVERIANDGSIIVKDMFNKSSNIQMFFNYPVSFPDAPEVKAKIQTTFGNIGKIKVAPQAIYPSDQLEALVGKKCFIEYEKVVKLTV